MKAILLLGVAVSSLEMKLSGQEIGPIQCDRPDQTETPFTVPKNHLQFEFGSSFEKVDFYNSTIVHPTLLSKFGLTDRMELRLITEFLTEKYSDPGNSITSSQSGLNPITVGFKVNLLEEKRWIPKTSFIGHLTIPGLASEHFQSHYYAPAFRFTMQHTLTEKFSLSYNLGAEWNGFNADPAFLYTLTTGYSITDKIGSYIELFGFMNDNFEEHQFDMGFSYLIKNNILADVSGGFGLTEDSPDYYFAVGFSFRLKD